MITLRVTPFVPGSARGILRLGTDASPGSILLLRQAEASRLAADPAGIILVGAAPFSHPALRLLSRGIPTVLAEEDRLGALSEGMEVFVDGRAGLVASPIPERLPSAAPPPPPEPARPLRTKDGVSVELRCSVTNAAGAAAALAVGAAGIGLTRSEYLFPEDGSRPDAAFLERACGEVCWKAGPLAVTFRLVDIAGDKRPPWLEEVPGIAGVLGLQGSRLYFAEPVRGVFLAELEALGRLCGRYPIRILLPYVVSLAELETLVAEIRRCLPANVPVGSMLETPAAALAVREFLEAADFVALGCNDLMQCLFAADRDLPELRAYLDPYAPALYRFLGMVAGLAGQALGRVQVNGLLSQLPGVLSAMIGLGYRIFSVDPAMLPWLAEDVCRTDTAQAARLAQSVREAGRPEEVKRLLGIGA